MELSLSCAAWGTLLPLLVLGCSAATTPASGNVPPPASTAAPTEASPVASSAASAVAPPAAASNAAAQAPAPQPPAADPCALPPLRVVVPKVPKQWSPSAFDVGPDGRLHWIVQDLMSKEAELFALALDAADAKPQRVRGVKVSGSVGAMVAGRDGYWLGTDDMSKGVCAGRVVWLGRDAQKAVPASEPGCLSGPVRAPGAEAIWGTRKTYTHPMNVVVAKGAPPGGLSPLPRGFEGNLETIAHASDGVYLAFDHGEVLKRSPDGKMGHVFQPLFLTPTATSHALAVHGDHVYLASSPYRSSLEIFQMPRKGGKRDKIATLDTKDTAIELFAADGGVVVLLSPNGKPKQLLLVDPRGVCPRVELPVPDLVGHVVVEREVVYTLRDGAILASSLGARASAASGAGSPASAAPPTPTAP